MIRVLYIGDPSSVHDIKWVSFFSTQPNYEAFFLVQEHEMTLVTPERQKLFDELQITVVGPIKSYSLWRFWENNESLKKIKEVINEHQIDIVHPLFATPFALWTRKPSIPSVITTRGSDVHVVLSGLGKGSFLSKMHGAILLGKFKSAFENAGAISCTSQGQLNRLNQLFQTKLKGEVIRTGVNVEKINSLQPAIELPEKLSGKKIIFLPRYIQPIYQTELQLDALAALPESEKTNLGLVLIKGKRTDSAYMVIVQNKLEKCGLAYEVFESLSQHEMWSMFKLSALAIMAPKTDGTPNSALEAMAAKCPLILGNFNYDQDLFSDDFCLRMKTSNSSELTELITSAVENYSEQKLEKAFENVSRFGNRQVEMERLGKIYLSLTKS